MIVDIAFETEMGALKWVFETAAKINIMGIGNSQTRK